MNFSIELNDELFHDALNINSQLFYPLSGFMTHLDYRSVVDDMCLAAGDVWSIPITLDVKKDIYLRIFSVDRVSLNYRGKEVGYIKIEDAYKIEKPEEDVLKVFKTLDLNHPGAKKELKKSIYRIGGKVTLDKSAYPDDYVLPEYTKNVFKERRWKTIVGFQTRNPIHRAHEYLQRVGLEICDGLFINPLVGWKKAGDFSEKAVVAGYEAMLNHYFNRERVLFVVLRTPMRYAGPREAIFHALIRRNYGCTHFIIGRDHAGVGSYYSEYEAHALAREILQKKDLGIELLLLNEPYYCSLCGHVVTSKTCGHSERYKEKINGTKIRSLLAKDIRPEERYMRPEVADAIIALGEDKFIGSD